jgi:hypothetical protein
MKRRFLLVLVGVLCACSTVSGNAQGFLFGAPGVPPDTIRIAPFGFRYTTSLFSLSQNVRSFNDSLAKYGYGRFAATSIGMSIGAMTLLGENVLIFSNFYGAFTAGASTSYFSWLWTLGVEGMYGYILLKNEVFRLYPLGGLNLNVRYMHTRERLVITPSMLNRASLPEPFEIAMWSSPDYAFTLGVGADVLIPNVTNRLYEYETGTYRLDWTIGLHLLYNTGNLTDLLSAGRRNNTWTVSGMTVDGLPSVSPQGLSIRVMIMQDLVKVK